VSAGRTYPTTAEPAPDRPTRGDLVSLLRSGLRLMKPEPGIGHSAREFWRKSVEDALQREQQGEVLEAEAKRRALANREIADLRVSGGKVIDVGTMDAFGRRFGVKVLRPGGAR
jgi:hypothetical protein